MKGIVALTRKPPTCLNINRWLNTAIFCPMTDRYANFDELRRNESENGDYAVFYREVDSDVAILAPHGGGIEPGTADIADALAGCDYTFYAFKGLKPAGNAVLHISSHRFDEPSGLKAAQNARVAVTIHGSRDTTEMVHVGGRDEVLKARLVDALRAAGFTAVISKVPGLCGIHPENLCNRGRSGKGVQLEISRGLRERLFKDLDHRSLRSRTTGFYRFVKALRPGLAPVSGDGGCRGTED